MNNLSREELKQKLGEIDFWPELLPILNNYLYQYVHSKDLEMVRLLLNAGANPNPEDDLDCFLHHLFHEYKVTRTTAGDRVLELMKILLEAGANPNRVWCNNYRAYDYAAVEDIEPVKRLLEKYGADKKIREYI
jgi:ankyrin repeat protein